MTRNDSRLLRFTLSVAAFFIVCIPIACKDTVSAPDLNDIVFPAKGVSYGKQVEPLFLNGCAYTGCHDSETRAGGLSLENFQETLDSDPNVIVPGDTARSKLIWSIEGKNAMARMPLDRPYLNTNQTNGLKQWILEGAQNN